MDYHIPTVMVLCEECLFLLLHCVCTVLEYCDFVNIDMIVRGTTECNRVMILLFESFRSTSMHRLRTCPLLLPSFAFRSLIKPSTTITRTATVKSLGDHVGVKRRSGRFLRNVLLFNGTLLGGGSLYYFLYLTPKQQRQVRVTFEGIQRAFRFVMDPNGR